MTVGIAPRQGPVIDAADLLPSVYFAGPIDYTEHRAPGAHKQDNWRHRFFGDLPIEMLCPTCLNAGPAEAGDIKWERTPQDIMETNKRALRRATYFVGYFPGDVATFGTPIETWEWMHDPRRPGWENQNAVLIHPSRPGAFVQYLALQYDLIVVRSFEEARQWLVRRLSSP